MTATFTVLGLGGYSRVPFGSFDKNVSVNSKSFVQNFTVLGLGGYSRAPFGSFASRVHYTVLGLGGYSRPPWGRFGGRTAALPEDPGGDYSLIPLYRRHKKKLDDELAEIALRLRDIAIDIPLPGHSFPVIYNRPLLEPFSDQQQTIKVLVSRRMRRARAQAEYEQLLRRQQDDDDDSAILLLWP